MRHLGCQRELGIIGEFEVVAAGMTADDPALLQGDDDLWVEVPVALGEGAWIAGDDVEDSGCPGAQGRPEAAEPVQRGALVAGEVTVAGAQAALKVERDCENRQPAEPPIKIIKTGVCQKGGFFETQPTAGRHRPPDDPLPQGSNPRQPYPPDFRQVPRRLLHRQGPYRAQAIAITAVQKPAWPGCHGPVPTSIAMV